MSDLGISISLDSAQYTRGLAAVQQQTTAATASVSKELAQIGTTSQQSGAAVSAFTQNLGGLGSVLSGGLGTVALAGAAGAAVLKFGEALLQVSKESIEIASKVRGVNAALGFAAGSADAGAAAYSRFKDTANELGISIEKNQVAYKNFIVSATQSGQTMNAAEKEFKQVAIAMTAMGLSADDSNGVLLALGQIASKGTVSAEELRGQIGERLPGAFAIAARSIGVTESKLNDMLQKGEVVSKDFLPKFTQELEKTFGATAQSQLNSYQAELNRLDNTFFELKTSLGEALLPVVTSVVTALNEFINGVRDFGNTYEGQQTIENLSEAFNVLKDSTVDTLAIFKEIAASVSSGGTFASAIKDFSETIKFAAEVYKFLDIKRLFRDEKVKPVQSVVGDELGAYYREKEGDVKKFAETATNEIAKVKKATKELAQAGSLGDFENQLKKINETFQNKKLSGSQVTDLLGKKEDIEAQIKRLKELYGIVKTETDPATGSLVSLKKQLAEIQTQINESPNDLNLLTVLQSQAVATTASIKDVENQIAKAKRMAETGGVLPTISGISNLPSQGQIAPAENILIAPKADTSDLDKLISKLNEVDKALLGTQRNVEEAFKQFKESQITALGDAIFNIGSAFGNVATGSQTAEVAFQQFVKETLNAVLVSAPRLLGLNLLKEALTTPPPISWGLVAGGVALLGISGLAGGLISQIGQQPESIASQAATGTGLTGAAATQATAQGLGAANNAPQTITQVTVVLETNGIIREIQRQEYVNGELKGL